MSISSPEIILALDLEDRAQINQVLKSTGDRLTWVKVGLQSYLRDGASLVEELADSGKKVFLDLKLHDIPNTMEKALESLAGLPVGMITLHACAGPEALHRCANFARETMPDVTLLGVTVLTSTNQEGLEAIGVKSPVEEQVSRLASLAVDQGIGGIVCSPLELPRLRQALPQQDNSGYPRDSSSQCRCRRSKENYDSCKCQAGWCQFIWSLADLFWRP